MADIKISELPAASAVATTDQLEANQSGTSRRITVAQLFTSPALTDVPTAPTAAVNTNDTQIATTAFVVAQIADDAPTKTGGGASGTWAISISGQAATVATVTTSQVNGAIAGLTAGDVGSYAILQHETGAGSVSYGGTKAGSDLRYGHFDDPAGTYAWNDGGTPAGTWRCLGTTGGLGDIALWLRIS